MFFNEQLGQNIGADSIDQLKVGFFVATFHNINSC